MKAALLKNWNDLEMTELEKPIPQGNEALLKMVYGGVCGSDVTVYKGLHMTAKAPVVLCHEILGVIETLPEGYKGDFKEGDRVVVNPVVECGTCAACKSGYSNACENLKLLGIHKNGGFEEYTVADVDKLVKAPEGLSDEVAALSEPFAVAAHVCRRAGVNETSKVFIAGAGTIGLVVASYAKRLGAKSVTVSEINPDRIALAKKLSLDTVNPMEADLKEVAKEKTNGAGFDIVIDATGAKASLLVLPDICKVGGTVMSLGLSGAPVEFILGKVSFKEQTLVGSRLYSQEDFANGVDALLELSKNLPVEAIVSDIYPLSETPEALAKMMSGKNIGKILISCK